MLVYRTVALITSSVNNKKRIDTFHDSLGGEQTHKHAHTHTDDPHSINFKKPGMRWPAAGVRLV